MSKTDLIPLSLSPPLFWIDFRKLRRNVNRRRKRGWDSLDEFIESFGNVSDVGDVWWNLSKNVLFLFNDDLVGSDVGIDDDDKLGNGIFVNDIGLDFIGLEIIWNGWIVVEVDDNDEIDVGDKAK